MQPGKQAPGVRPIIRFSTFFLLYVRPFTQSENLVVAYLVGIKRFQLIDAGNKRLLTGDIQPT